VHDQIALAGIVENGQEPPAGLAGIRQNFGAQNKAAGAQFACLINCHVAVVASVENCVVGLPCCRDACARFSASSSEGANVSAPGAGVRLARRNVRKGWNCRSHITTWVLQLRHLLRNFCSADRPPASSSGTASIYSTTPFKPAILSDSSPKTRSAAAKNSGPLIWNTCQPSGTAVSDMRLRFWEISFTCVMSAISRMNSRDASTMPTEIAITISNSTVSDRQVPNTIRSPVGAVFSRCTALWASLMFQATITS